MTDATATVRRRYGRIASIYDWANLEGILYASARARAIELLDLKPGARVLDVACGTGANFALIEQRIGSSGELVGIDLRPPMLDRAGTRVARAGWDNVLLQEGAGYPETAGRRRDVIVPRPLAWSLSRLFAADCSRRPWRLVERDTRDATSERFTWGWVTAGAGAKAAA
jgi:SAM-dependent methyltransferase